jgi:glycosyltransferase involved in cell wall biosynthesis
MKILVVTQYFWPENFRINDLVAGLMERGHEVTVLTGIPNYPSGKFYEGYGFFKKSRQCYHGAKILRIPVIPRGKGGAFRLALNYFSFTFFAVFLSPFLCRGKTDVIVFSLSPVAEGVPAVLLKKLKNSNLIFWVQDLWPESISATGAFKNFLLQVLIKKILAIIYCSCDKILVQSRAYLSCIASIGISKDRMKYFPNFAEDFYRPIDLDMDAAERKVLPSGFIVMYAGNIGGAQDFPTIISAAERIKDYKEIRWVIIGEGRRRQWLKEEIAARNLLGNFLLLSKLPSETMPRYFSIADILLVSLKNEEIFKYTVPSKIQSYLACAKPIVAALSGEAARIIDESGGGISCPAENEEALAEAVLRLYRMSRAERNDIGLRGRKYFEQNFEKTKLLNEFNQIIGC